MFYFNCFPSTAPTIPIDLYHPIFGQFKTDCEEHDPTPGDNMFALEAMSYFYVNESERLIEFRRILQEHELPFKPQSNGSDLTGGHMKIGESLATLYWRGSWRLDLAAPSHCFKQASITLVW